MILQWINFKLEITPKRPSLLVQQADDQRVEAMTVGTYRGLAPGYGTAHLCSETTRGATMILLEPLLTSQCGSII
jgi:hypothetical protein